MPLTLEALAELPATVERLAARIAEIEAKLQHAVAADELVDVEEAARRTGRDPASIYKLVQRGKIARHYIGTSRRYRVRIGDITGQR